MLGYLLGLNEFLLTGKPVVTFKNRRPGPQLIDIDDPAQFEPAIERALARPPELLQAIREYADAIHPYRDGRSSERVLDAIDAFIAAGGRNRRRKPLKLVAQAEAASPHRLLGQRPLVVHSIAAHARIPFHHQGSACVVELLQPFRTSARRVALAAAVGGRGAAGHLFARTDAAVLHPHPGRGLGHVESRPLAGAAHQWRSPTARRRRCCSG